MEELSEMRVAVAYNIENDMNNRSSLQISESKHSSSNDSRKSIPSLSIQQSSINKS